MNGAKASVFGQGDYIYFAPNTFNSVSIYSTSGVQDYLVGSNGGITLNDAEVDATGDGDYFYFGGTSTATVHGSNETFAFRSSMGEATINGFSASDVIQFGSAYYSSWQALSGHITQSGADAVISFDANDSITLTNYKASDLTAASFKFV